MVGSSPTLPTNFVRFFGENMSLIILVILVGVFFGFFKELLSAGFQIGKFLFVLFAIYVLLKAC